MASIYELIKRDWNTYCLISAIIYIEEMSKPTKHFQIKNGKKFLCFHSLRLKMNDPEFVNNFFDITKKWEEKKDKLFIGPTFTKPRKENYSKQDFFYLSPIWLNMIIAECGKIPNRYSFEAAKKRIKYLKKYKKVPLNNSKNLFNKLIKDKVLAAGAFIVSMDLEFRGIQSGAPSLCMSERYRDFLEFMLKIASKWNWTKNTKLSKVNIENCRKLGINASPQYEFRVNINGLKEIYNLSGPLINSLKNKCINFHVKRSENYLPLGYHHQKNKPKEKILAELKKRKNLSTTDLQFVTGTRTDVVLEHLYSLEKRGKVKKERKGKRYIWDIA